MSDPTSAPNAEDRPAQGRVRSQGGNSAIPPFVDEPIATRGSSAGRNADSLSETDRLELIREVVEIDQVDRANAPESTERVEVRDVSTDAEWTRPPSPPTPDTAAADEDVWSGEIGPESTVPIGASEFSPWKPASTGPSDPEAPLVEDDFQILEPLGSGGMGEVFRALQKSLRKPVALKILKREALDSPSRVRRFLAEARALARLKHPQIVGVHGIGRMSDGRYFLVMDLLEGGGTLHNLINDGPVAFEHAAKLVATIAGAIEHAHGRGVIHRDLKPSNVLLDRDGVPHVTDFGLAKVFDAIDPDHPQTTADQILGTPHFMSPEQADPSRGPITPRTDVYGLGGILFALLTGRPPLEGDSITQLIGQLVSSDPVRSPRELRPGVPPALEEICRKCLQKDTAERYGSAADVAQALESWLESRTPTNGVRESEDGGTGTRPAVPRGAWSTDRSLKDGRRRRTGQEWAARESPASRSSLSRFAKKSSILVIASLLIFGSATVLNFTWPSRGPHQPARASLDPLSDVPQSSLQSASRPSLEHFAVLGYRPMNLTDLKQEAERRGIPLIVKNVDPRVAVAGLMADKGSMSIFYAFGPGAYLPLGYSPYDRNDTENGMPRVLVRDSDQTLFVWISGRTFNQGDFRGVKPVLDFEGNECKPHEVEVSSFYLQETEVTNKEIERYLRSNPGIKRARWIMARDLLISHLKTSEVIDRYPAVCINRLIAQEYAASVSGSLPTEAEWEYAARSRGQNQKWALKDSRGIEKPRAHLLGPGALDPFPKHVKTFVGHDETDHGIFDMTGSVREWCLDKYRAYDEILADRKPDAGPLKDPGLAEEFAAVEPSSKYVVRGGSFRTQPDEALTFQRGAAEASTEDLDLGFRVILRCPIVPEESDE